jgi:ATP adenylyltransferase
MYDRLWAPWRYKYLKGNDKEASEGCIFCTKPNANRDKENLIIFQGNRGFVMMNKYPYTNGHLLIAPYRHLNDLGKCSQDEKLEMFQLIDRSVSALRASMNPDAFNIGMNLGRTAGAGIEDHIHFHVVPRWNGDTNFMPVIGETRVISMSLEEGWEVLTKHFKAG